MSNRLYLYIVFLVTATIAVAQEPGLISTISVNTSVSKVVQNQSTDLILIQGGYESGFRQGMICTISRYGVKIADILLVDLRRMSSIALIVEIADGQTITRGDRVGVKTLKI